MPNVVRDGGRMWNLQDELQDTIAMVPDRCYATMYAEIVDNANANGQFDPATGVQKKSSAKAAPSYTNVFAEALIADPRIEIVVEATGDPAADRYPFSVKPDKPVTVDAADVLYKCGWSPFEGHTFTSSIDSTIVNGEVVWKNGALTGAIAGKRLDFSRPR